MLGIVRAMTRPAPWSIDWFRHVRELIEPVDYLTRPYYDQWLQTYAAMMVNSGVATVEELATGKSAGADPRPAAADTARQGRRRPMRTTTRFDRAGDRAAALRRRRCRAAPGSTPSGAHPAAAICARPPGCGRRRITAPTSSPTPAPRGDRAGRAALHGRLRGDRALAGGDRPRATASISISGRATLSRPETPGDRCRAEATRTRPRLRRTLACARCWRSLNGLTGRGPVLAATTGRRRSARRSAGRRRAARRTTKRPITPRRSRRSRGWSTATPRRPARRWRRASRPGGGPISTRRTAIRSSFPPPTATIDDDAGHDRHRHHHPDH